MATNRSVSTETSSPAATTSAKATSPNEVSNRTRARLIIEAKCTPVVVIRTNTKAVIGWATDDNYRTPLIRAAIDMAARNHTLALKAIFHSDRGSNYTSSEFAATLEWHDLRQSVGRTGVCYDNAMAESFFAALKNERVHRTVYPTREHARKDVTHYIEMRYNTKRLHSALDYKTPQEVHDEYLSRHKAT